MTYEPVFVSTGNDRAPAWRLSTLSVHAHDADPLLHSFPHAVSTMRVPSGSRTSRRGSHPPLVPLSTIRRSSPAVPSMANVSTSEFGEMPSDTLVFRAITGGVTGRNRSMWRL